MFKSLYVLEVMRYVFILIIIVATMIFIKSFFNSSIQETIQEFNPKNLGVVEVPTPPTVVVDGKTYTLE